MSEPPILPVTDESPGHEMTTSPSPYPVESLDPDDDDGTMPESVEALADAVVGHRIVSVEQGVEMPSRYYGTELGTVITLDNGRRVKMVGESDCCAYTELQAFLLHPERVDHIITGVGTTDGYTTWHVYADMGDVLEMTVGWSCGNPFYYAYGFTITVEDAEPHPDVTADSAQSDVQP